jgi:hypothetical protein
MEMVMYSGQIAADGRRYATGLGPTVAPNGAGKPVTHGTLDPVLADLGDLNALLNRSVADGVTNSTTTVTSATAAFTQADVGARVSGAGIPAGATVATVSNGTTVVLSAAATASASSVALTIERTLAKLVGTHS